jgi:hypothetical protein
MGLCLSDLQFNHTSYLIPASVVASGPCEICVVSKTPATVVGERVLGPLVRSVTGCFEQVSSVFTYFNRTVELPKDTIERLQKKIDSVEKEIAEKKESCELLKNKYKEEGKKVKQYVLMQLNVLEKRTLESMDLQEKIRLVQLVRELVLGCKQAGHTECAEEAEKTYKIHIDWVVGAKARIKQHDALIQEINGVKIYTEKMREQLKASYSAGQKELEVLLEKQADLARQIGTARKQI